MKHIKISQQSLSFAGLALAGVALYVIPQILRPQSIIYASSIDVSASALNSKYGDKSYTERMSANCRFGLEKLNKNDLYIESQFTTQAIAQNHRIDHNAKIRQINNCSKRTVPQQALPKDRGTSLKVAIERLDSEIARQRAQNINYPIAAIIAIDSIEPQSNRQADDVGEIVQKIEKIVKKEHAVIALVGSSPDLQNELTEKLKNTAGVEINSFDEIDSVTAKVIESARKLAPVK
jgi:hypothetical protein